MVNMATPHVVPSHTIVSGARRINANWSRAADDSTETKLKQTVSGTKSCRYSRGVG
jgi:hypothetical protein